VELRQYVTLLTRWAWLIALAIILGAAGGFGLSWATTPVYESSTKLLINQAPASSATPDYASVLTSERLARTYAELLRTRPVLEQVIADLKLTQTPAQLERRMAVEVVRDTQLIILTVEDTDPARAAAIANETVSVFMRLNRETQASRYAESTRSLADELAKVQTDIDQTQASLNALSGQTPAVRDERSRLQTLLAQYRDSYSTILNSLESVRLAEARSTNSVNVVESAQATTIPVRPRTLLNILLGAVAGAILALAVVLLLEYLDDTVKTSEEAARLTGLPSLAAIARIDGREPPDKLIVAIDSRSPTAESYRLLRVNAQLAAIDRPLRTLMVTSSTPLEGKSTMIANLAAAFAQAGKRVILVDTDLRRPTLHKIFRVSNARGITTALANRDQSVSTYLVPTSVANLSLLPSGPLPPNPADLLGSQRMAALIQELTSQADIVLFDSPPVLAVVDASILARATDATLLVVLAEKTRSNMLRRTREQLAQSGAKMVGVVLNKATSARDTYYGSYTYYYGSDPVAHRARGRFKLPSTRRKGERTMLVEPEHAGERNGVATYATGTSRNGSGPNHE
jgi:non-specific protein-tyrosine kinase